MPNPSEQLDKRPAATDKHVVRFRIFILFGLLVTALAACADEKLPALNVDGIIYTNVTVTKVTATDIYFTYAGGMGNAKLKNLEPDLQEHFHFNPAKASEVEGKQAQANAQYHDYVIHQPTPKPPVEEDESQRTPAAHASELSWGTDLPTVMKQAQSEKKTVLVDFTGSDWCGWCIKFDQDVLSTAQFAAYAQKKLLLVKLDYPRYKKQETALKQANAFQSEQFHVNSFPTLVLLDRFGNELGRQVGYLAGGPDAFIAQLERFSRH